MLNIGFESLDPFHKEKQLINKKRSNKQIQNDSKANAFISITVDETHNYPSLNRPFVRINIR
jgi:hypothetical protein